MASTPRHANDSAVRDRGSGSIEDRLYPAGTLIKVTAEVCLGAAATEEQINEYLRYSMTESGGCSMANPLLNGSIDVWEFDVDVTRYVGRKEEYDSVDLPGGGREYRIRRIIERAPSPNAHGTETCKPEAVQPKETKP